MLVSAARPVRQLPGPGSVVREAEGDGVDKDDKEAVVEGVGVRVGVREEEGVWLGVDVLLGVPEGVRLGVGVPLGEGSAEGAVKVRVPEKAVRVICGSDPLFMLGALHWPVQGLSVETPTAA